MTDGLSQFRSEQKCHVEGTNKQEVLNWTVLFELNCSFWWRCTGYSERRSQDLESREVRRRSSYMPSKTKASAGGARVQLCTYNPDFLYSLLACTDTNLFSGSRTGAAAFTQAHGLYLFMKTLMLSGLFFFFRTHAPHAKSQRSRLRPLLSRQHRGQLSTPTNNSFAHLSNVVFRGSTNVAPSHYYVFAMQWAPRDLWTSRVNKTFWRRNSSCVVVIIVDVSEMGRSSSNALYLVEKNVILYNCFANYPAWFLGL